MQPIILMENVSKFYNQNQVCALDDVNVTINKGEFVFIVGPSGAGKSTFMKMLLREILPDSGSVFINDFDVVGMKNKNIPYLRRSLGVVFQDYRLLPNKTIYDNIAFAMRVIEAPRKLIQSSVFSVLDIVGLRDKFKCYPHQLSGGEQQRVAIARAIVNRPPILICDEPTGNLDPQTTWGIMEIFHKINNSGTTIVMATHNKEIVDTMKKRVITISNGKIIRDSEGGYDFEVEN